MTAGTLSRVTKAFCAYAVLTGSSAFAQVYTAFEIDSLGGRGFDSFQLGQANMNSSGHVYANVSTSAGFRIVLTGENGVGSTDVGLANLFSQNGIEIRGVSSTGRIAGTAYGPLIFGPQNTSAFISGPNGVGRTDILPAGSALLVDGQSFTVASSRVYGMNSQGQLIGSVELPGVGTGGSLGFVTGPNGNGVSLLPTTVNDSNGQARTLRLSPAFINDSGQMHGVYLARSLGAPDEFGRFTTDTGGTGLRLTGSLVPPSTTTMAMSATGRLLQVSAPEWSISGPNGVGATVFSNTNLAPGVFTEFQGVNSTGQVVGRIGRNAVVSGPDATGFTDLNTLVQLPAGRHLYHAFSINDSGQILARALTDQLYLLTPVPEPETYAMLLAGMLLLMLRVGFQRSKSAVAA